MSDQLLVGFEQIRGEERILGLTPNLGRARCVLVRSGEQISGLTPKLSRARRVVNMGIRASVNGR